MLDFNHSTSSHHAINNMIDNALSTHHQQQSPRSYLGASRIGVACSRALQYEYSNTPRDADKAFPGRILRIFEAGHVFEELLIGWLTAAGFTLRTTQEDGKQFGFVTANGCFAGHIDGIITAAPSHIEMGLPALWEAKSLSNRSWKDTVKRGVSKSKPIYAAQIAIYQAYMEKTVRGISQNPCLFTAINKDTAELYHEYVPFDPWLAQAMSDKAVKIIHATAAQELLPRISNSAGHRECTYCAWRNHCWNATHSSSSIHTT